jgi:hypothetical protein
MRDDRCEYCGVPEISHLECSRMSDGQVKCVLNIRAFLSEIEINGRFAPTVSKYAGRDCPCGMASSQCEYHR